MEERAAVEAQPFQTILGAWPPGAFDDKPDRALNRALWRVAQMRRREKDLPFADRHIVYSARFGNLQEHIAAQLVEELLGRVVMEVGPLVRAADDLHDHARILEHRLIANRRLQQMAVLVNPAIDLNGRRKLSIVIAPSLCSWPV